MTAPTTPARRAALRRLLEDCEADWLTHWTMIGRDEVKRLRFDGLIECDPEEPECYTLTPAGLEAARAERDAPSR